MTGMILAAGLGVRLRPLTETTPKAMIEVGGRPLIEYAVDGYKRAGINRIIINLHHLGGVIKAHLGDGSAFGVDILYSEEDPLLGTGGAIVNVEHLLGDDTFVTVNADTIVDLDLADVLEFHRRHCAVATMVLRKDERMADYGMIGTAPDGRITDFLGKRFPGATTDGGAPAPEHYMYTGVQVLERQVFSHMPRKGAFSMTKVTYPGMLEAGLPVYGYPFGGTWITVGTAEELAAARTALGDSGL